MTDQGRTQAVSAYTAGPWKLSHSGQQIHGPRGQWIAIIKCESCPAHEAGNAALIAGAPDLLEALMKVRAIIVDAAMTGFNCHEGDWAERLFASQADSAAAVRKACPGAERTGLASSQPDTNEQTKGISP